MCQFPLIYHATLPLIHLSIIPVGHGDWKAPDEKIGTAARPTFGFLVALMFASDPAKGLQNEGRPGALTAQLTRYRPRV